MILQPFIENSIEHGFKNISSGGEILIEFKKTENNLVIHISDNGSGIEISNNDNKHISRATQITTDRLFLLNKLKKSNATFTITENKPRGTKIEIILPLLYKNEITHH
jgi:LytS/YehU family sensor histidine kinase